MKENKLSLKEEFLHKNVEKEQKLYEHLLNVAEKFAEFGEKIDFENTCYVIGLLHDLGKVNEKF